MNNETNDAHIQTEEVEVEVEDMLKVTKGRFTLFPIKHTDIWKMYKKHQSVDWKASEIKYASDIKDWAKLPDDEKHFIKHVLAFFAASDTIILENIESNFSDEVQWPEARAFYAFQGNIEMVHSETYGLHIETLISDLVERNKLFNAIELIPCVKKKAEWALKYIDRDHAPFKKRLAGITGVEGIFFSGSFCAIYWLKSRGLMLNGLCKSNEFIARDEGLHTEFAILLHNKLKNRLTNEEIHEIFKEAVEIESEFITESIPCKLIGMNSDLMIRYIKFVANFWMTKFITDTGKKCTKLYPDIENPFTFMDINGMDGKTNFFEQTVTEYSSASSKINTETKETEVKKSEFIELDDDF